MSHPSPGVLDFPIEKISFISSLAVDAHYPNADRDRSGYTVSDSMIKNVEIAERNERTRHNQHPHDFRWSLRLLPHGAHSMTDYRRCYPIILCTYSVALCASGGFGSRLRADGRLELSEKAGRPPGKMTAPENVIADCAGLLRLFPQCRPLALSGALEWRRCGGSDLGP